MCLFNQVGFYCYVMYKWQPTPSLFRALLDAEYQHQWVPPGIHILFLKMLLQAQSSAVHVWAPEIALRAAGTRAFCLRMIKGCSHWTGAHCNQDGACSLTQQHLQERTGQSKSACIFKNSCGFIFASLLLTLSHLKNKDISSHRAICEDVQQFFVVEKNQNM